MLELQVANPDVSNGNIAVSWCVDPETLKHLADHNIKDPQVVIVVAPTQNYHPRREYRKVVPLQDLMTYLECHSAGENQIRAFLSFKDKKDVRGAFLSRENGYFKTDILSEDGKEWSYIFNRYDHKINQYVRSPEIAASIVMVNVPAGVFAKEPAQWEKTWVNHWFRSKPIDQCDFRRRRMLAYTVQPLVMLLDVMVVRTLLLLVASLWWSRGLTLKYHLHPIQYSLTDSAGLVLGGSWCVPKIDDDSSYSDLTVSYAFRSLWKLVFTPPALFAIAMITHFHVWLMASIVVVASIILIMLAFALADGALTKFTNWLDKLLTDENQAPWYMDQEEMQTITCTKDFKARTSLSALPAKHRTIRLRFQDLKSKVCRPFSS